MSLLEASALMKTYITGRNLLGVVTARFTAVNDVSFAVEPGETLALVGESGAGKSTTGRLVLRLIQPDSGAVTFEGQNLLDLSRKEMRATRRRMQMIFQDPYSSLDPRIPIGESVGEPLLVHDGMGRNERLTRAADLLERVGIGAQALDAYPGELSGGQLQRVAIARALTVEPSLIVCDEPVAALDVSVRAQVLNLMRELQEERGLAYLFISHDLALVEVIADRVAVMKNGEIVEIGDVEAVFQTPQHPYTAELLSAIPVPLPPSLRPVAG
jgi:peptide/nickel transport system ATP-binding protein/oligopeptide transport system ATP-binding protein